MKYEKLLDRLQKTMGFKPTQTNLAEILGMNQAGIAGRAKRNSEFSEEEVQRIEQFFAINLSDDNTVELSYYPSLFKGGGNEGVIKVSIACIPEYNANNNYIVISNVGDSMHPTIYNDDKLIILSTEGLEVIQDNKIYLFEYKNKPYLKRLVNNIDSIIIKSDSELVKDVIIKDFENLKLNGRVVALMRELI